MYIFLNPTSGSVFSSHDSEAPLWFSSCHSFTLPKTASCWLILPSEFPPKAAVSYCASARTPFISSPSGGGGCEVTLPNNSRPLSIVPLLFLSSASHESSEPAAIQENCRGVPLPSRSNSTAFSALVMAKPFPKTSPPAGDPPPTLGSQKPKQPQLSPS